MSKKSNPLQTKGPVCKEIGCFSPPTVKGYCRLHFIKMVSQKEEEAAAREEEIAGARERRSRDRFKGIETHLEDENVEPNVVAHIGELDTDIEDLDLEPGASAPGKSRKAG